MTPSDALRTAAAEALERCAALVDEPTIIRQIDEPISRAVETFECDDNAEPSAQTFLRTVAAFLRHLYATAFPAGRQLSESQARDEAVAFLERAHPSHGTSGYDQALADAIDPASSGWEVVLARIAELLKTQLREVYMRSVFARCVDFVDPLMRCAMAAVLVERCRTPEPLRKGPSERLAAHIVDLLIIDLATRNQAGGATGAMHDLFG